MKKYQGRRSIWIIAGIIALLITVGIIRSISSSNTQERSSAGTAGQEVLATGLDIPWQAVQLPDGAILVTERSGQLKRIGDNGKTFTIPGVHHAGEGGLLGLAVHPEYADNHWIYMYATQERDGRITNRVDRYQYRNDELSDRTVVLQDIPGAKFHDGGALAFGPDGYLYVSTGDANDEASAQDTKILSGKILRITDDGKVPADNPFGNEVYSYGHRNPQGLAWDGQDRLWATEHGPSGLQSGYDELNRIQKGANYGWPLVKGDETRPGLTRPVVHSGPDETWAPAGLAYSDGALYFAGLRGKTLYKAQVSENGETADITRHLHDMYGRLRGITALDGGELLLTTSNRDGRGNPAVNDDLVLKVAPGRL